MHCKAHLDSPIEVEDFEAPLPDEFWAGRRMKLLLDTHTFSLDDQFGASFNLDAELLSKLLREVAL